MSSGESEDALGVRAGIVVTGTEVLTGRVADRNGPWLAERLFDLGIDVVRVDVVGDRPEDLRASLEDLARAGAGIILTSGGLGPTADDLTADVVAAFQGRPMAVDEALEGRIAEIVSGLRRRPGVDPVAVARAVTKQARVPDGATVLEPVGTAPGLVVPPSDLGGPTVVVLPGPPRELQGMWEAALAADPFVAAAADRRPTHTAELRLFGIPESEIAATLLAAEEGGVALDRLEVTTCMRRGEIEVVTRFAPDERDLYDAFEAVVRERHADTLFSDDGSSVDELVARGLDERGWTIATAESCTGGLLAGRLTAPAGASARVLGGLVVYANEAKTALAGVPASLIDSVGAVSEEVAEALADGVRERLGVDVGVGITGIAGPGGGSEDKPVGTVCFSVAGPDGQRATRRVHLPGDRGDVRDRSTTVAMHLVLGLLRGDDVPPVSLP